MSPATVDPVVLEKIVRERERLFASDHSLVHEYHVLSALMNLGHLEDEHREDVLSALNVPKDPARRQIRGREALRRLTAAYQALHSRDDHCQE